MSQPHEHVRIEGSERKLAPGARFIRPADLEKGLAVTVHLRRPPDAPALPSLEEWAGIPLGRRKFPTHAKFAAQQGAAQADLDKVIGFARAHGLTVDEASASRRTVALTGTVARMNTSFGVTLGYYECGSETYLGHEGFVHVPGDIQPLVESVLGLDNRRIARPHFTTGRMVRSAGDESPDGAPAAGFFPLTPVQVASLYNFPTNSAAGQTIGIIELGGGYARSDVSAFFADLRLSTPHLTDVSVDGAVNSPAGNINNVTLQDSDIEVVLDIDLAGAVAPGAAIAVYFAPNTERGFADAVKQAVDDTVNRPSVLSISWGSSEDGWTAAGRTTMSNAFTDAAALGITVLAAAGDWGSDSQVGDGKAHVIYPSSDPAVVSCGGTYIATAVGSTFTEGTWNDGAGATGGGVSDVFQLPSWQQGAGVPVSINDGKTVGRGVPDLAGNASPSSGYTLTLYGQPTTNLLVTSGRGAGGPLGTIGGTSAVAPLYAGLLSVIAATLRSRFGLINPTLYKFPTVFNDVNDAANNQWSGEKKKAPSYTSGPGWDACTGLGRLDGAALLELLTAESGFGTILGLVKDSNEIGIGDATVLVKSPTIISPGTGNTLQVSTDGSGHYSTGPLPVNDYEMRVIQDGFVPAEAEVTVPAGTAIIVQNFTLAQTLPFSISGQVSDVTGAPVVATVRLTQNSPVPGVITTVTNPAGHYSITMDPGPYDGTYTMDFMAQGFAPEHRTFTIPNGAHIILNITLVKQGVLAGHITDQGGSPLTGAKVAVGTSQTVTDAAGAYSIMVDPGQYAVTASDPGYTPLSASISIPPGVTVTQNFSLTKTLPGFITGTVFFDSTGGGGPLGGARVVAVNETMTTSGADGGYMLSSLQPGPTRITVSHGGLYNPDNATVTVISGETVHQDFVLVRKGTTS
jgi:kumamolisin